MANARSRGTAVLFYLVAVDRDLACRGAGGASAEAAARSCGGRDGRVGIAGWRRHPPPERASPVTRSLPQRDRPSALRFDHDRAQRHPCRGWPRNGGFRFDDRLVRRSRRRGGRTLYQRLPAAPSRDGGRGPRARPKRNHPPLLLRRSRLLVAEWRRALPGAERQCPPAASPRPPAFREARPVATERRGDNSGGASFLHGIEGIALRFLGASRQETFVLWRVLRAVPPAADRAQLHRGWDATAEGLRRGPHHRLPL